MSPAPFHLPAVRGIDGAAVANCRDPREPIIMRKPANGVVIPLSARRSDNFTPPSLKPVKTETGETGGEKEVEFTIRIPTPSERDTLGARLFEMGLTSVEQQTIRATTIDELFKMDWGFGEKNEEHAEALASQLDNFWQRSSIDEQASAMWIEQEAQRILDEAAGAPAKESAPQPQRQIGIRENSQITLLIDGIMRKSERLRALAAEQMDYQRQSNQMIVRLHVLSMKPSHPENWPETVKLDRDETGLLTLECVDDLREFIGDTAWTELYRRIDRHFSLSEDERKNFDSPLGKPSDQTGSPGPSGDLESSAGKSTDSSTGHAQAGESETTTGKSSGSASESEAAR